MRVQMRVKSARRVMSEQGGREVPGGTVMLCTANPNACSRKCLELVQGRSDGASMRHQNSFVVSKERREGQRLRRGECEIVEDPPIGRDLATLCPGFL